MSWRVYHSDEAVLATVPTVLVGAAATFLHFILPASTIQVVSGLIAFGTLFTWAWQELVQGVNYFRRALGLIGLATLIVLGYTLN